MSDAQESIVRGNLRGKRHICILWTWQSPGCRGHCDGTGRTLLVGLLLFAWLAAAPAPLTLATIGGSPTPTPSEVETAPEYLRAPVTLEKLSQQDVRAVCYSRN